MKNMILFVAFTMLTAPIFAQDHEVQNDDIPAAVKQAFQNKYPGKAVIKWEKSGKNLEAEFKVDGTKYEAGFDYQGNWIETEYEVKMKDIPQPVKDAWKKTDYTTWKILSTKHVETPNQPNLYQYEVKKGKQTVELQFTPDGTQVSKEAK